MNKKVVYTVGYTMFAQNGQANFNDFFGELRKRNIQFLLDVRSVPYSKQFPQFNANSLALVGDSMEVKYGHVPELGAKATLAQDVFSKAHDVFLEDAVFPIAKSNRPEKTELYPDDEIVDFKKFRSDDCFVSGLNRISRACEQGFTVCLMCSESKPVMCHRFFLISRALEARYGEIIEVRHILRDEHGNIVDVSNKELKRQLKEQVLKKDVVRKMNIFERSFDTPCVVDKYDGIAIEERTDDFCDRFWNLLHGWKKESNNDIN